jgi:hypothetical protein
MTDVLVDMAKGNRKRSASLEKNEGIGTICVEVDNDDQAFCRCNLQNRERRSLQEIFKQCHPIQPKDDAACSIASPSKH